MPKSLDEVDLDPSAMADEDLANLLEGNVNDEAAEREWEERPDDEDAELDESEGDAESLAEGEPKAQADDKPKESDKAAKEGEQQGAQPELDPTKAFVLTKDGKHQIPFSTLEAERRARAEAERAANELAERSAAERNELIAKMNEMQAQLAALQQGTTSGAEAAAQAEEIASDDVLELIEEESPELAKIFRGLKAQISTLQGQIEQNARAAEEARHEVPRAKAREALQEAIDNNPKLVYLRAEDVGRYNRIAEIDQWLVGQAEFKGLPPAERLNKAIQTYEALNGVIQVPGSSAAGPSAPSPGKPSAKAQTPAPAPFTLSDIPGGSAPGREGERLEEVSAAALVDKFMEMDPGAVDRLLERGFI